MANVGDRLDAVGPFRSAMVPSKDEDPGRDVQILKLELEDYFKRVREAILADLREAQAQINTKT